VRACGTFAHIYRPRNEPLNIVVRQKENTALLIVFAFSICCFALAHGILVHFLCIERKGEILSLREVFLPITKGGRITASFCILVACLALWGGVLTIPAKLDKSMGIAYLVICTGLGVAPFASHGYFLYKRIGNHDGKYVFKAIPTSAEESQKAYRVFAIVVAIISTVGWVARYLSK
jgi:hypothetical protein